MIFVKRSRFLVLLVRELASKYRSALVFGFVLGLCGSLGILRLLPNIKNQYFKPVDRIGVIGGYTPTTLPIAIQRLISSGLTSIGPDGSAAAGLALSWEATDSGKAYIFHLKTDAVWHNGKPVVAGDVNYNIEGVTFTAVSNQELKVTLKDIYSPFPTLLVKPIFTTGLVGFGPYRVERIRLKGDTIQTLNLFPVENANNHRKEYRFYQTEALAAIGYKRGEVDRIEDISSEDFFKNWKQTENSSQIHYDRVVALFYNTKVPQLSERQFRQALSYAVPDLPFEQSDSPFMKDSWAQSNSLKKFSYNETQVARLLKASAGATASASLTLSTFQAFSSVADQIARQWTILGIPTTVKIVNDLSAGFDVLLTSQTLPPDPDQYPFWHSTQKDTNITGYANAKIDKLLEDGRRELDQVKRKKIYEDFAKRLTEDAPVRYLYFPSTYSILRVHR